MPCVCTQALATFDFSESEEAGVIGLISAVLNLGNIAFLKVKAGVSSAQVTPESRVFLTRAAKLLQVRPCVGWVGGWMVGWARACQACVCVAREREPCITPTPAACALRQIGGVVRGSQVARGVCCGATGSVAVGAWAWPCTLTH